MFETQKGKMCLVPRSPVSACCTTDCIPETGRETKEKQANGNCSPPLKGIWAKQFVIKVKLRMRTPDGKFELNIA